MPALDFALRSSWPAGTPLQSWPPVAGLSTVNSSVETLLSFVKQRNLVGPAHQLLNGKFKQLLPIIARQPFRPTGTLRFFRCANPLAEFEIFFGKFGWSKQLMLTDVNRAKRPYMRRHDATGRAEIFKHRMGLRDKTNPKFPCPLFRPLAIFRLTTTAWLRACTQADRPGEIGNFSVSALQFASQAQHWVTPCPIIEHARRLAGSAPFLAEAFYPGFPRLAQGKIWAMLTHKRSNEQAGFRDALGEPRAGFQNPFPSESIPDPNRVKSASDQEARQCEGGILSLAIAKTSNAAAKRW